jgi:hypothetical protein
VCDPEHVAILGKTARDQLRRALRQDLLRRFASPVLLAAARGDWAYVDDTRYGMYADSPDDATQIRVVTDQAHAGRCSALIELAKWAAENQSAKTVYLTLGTVPFKTGKTYRLSIWMKGEGESTPVELSAFSWKKDEHSWDVQSTAVLTPAWRQYELLFGLPKEGDPEYKSTMDTFYWRINFPTGTSRFWIDDVGLRKADLADEWTSWQAKGMDAHSVVADPLFVGPAQDNYRLQPASPALALGFEPLPFDKIGPYQDAMRAAWPIVEAPGAREAKTEN